MSAYPSTLLDHLGRHVTTVCHCWRLQRADGVELGFTDHDRQLVVDGTACQPETGFSASEATDALGLGADTVDVEGALSSERIRDEDIASGVYDGARIETLLVNWARPQDFALLRTATIGRITRTDGRFVAELDSTTHALDQPSGRFVSRLCDAQLGDSRCGFNLALAGYSGSGVVTGRLAASTIEVDGLAGFAAGWFSHGVLTWTSGARSGRRQRAEEHRIQAGVATLVLDWPGALPAIEEGDGFTIHAGCDKAFATCRSKFSNAVNFRGFPHLPGNDAVYGYVVDGGVFDGSPLTP